MGEVILYRINNIIEFVIFCLVVVNALGFFIFYMTREETVSQKHVKLYGLFMNLRKMDIIILSLSMIKGLAIIYCAITFGKNVFEYITIILTVSLILTVYNFKNIILEIINAIAPCIVLYLINILSNYQIEVETNHYISIIRITLIVFVCLYSIYVFLTNLEDSIHKNKNIRRNMNEEK